VVTYIVYEFYLSSIKDHFLHRVFVLFVLPWDVLNLSDFILVAAVFGLFPIFVCC
jgi:hypothetical protein